MTITTRATIAGVVLVLLATACAKDEPRATAPVRTPLDCAEVGGALERAECMAPYFAQAARSGDVEEALDELETLFENETLDDCHHPSHHLGHAVYEAEKDVASAMDLGDDFCGDGYYHGVVEAAVSGSHGDHAEHGGVPNVTEVCLPLQDDDDAPYDECVHGLGHGLMQATDFDLALSIDACESQLEDEDQDECWGGAMMENVMQFMDLGSEEFASEAATACEGHSFDSHKQEVCSEQIGEVTMFYFGHDLDLALDVCSSIADRAGRKECQEGARQQHAFATQN